MITNLEVGNAQQSITTELTQIQIIKAKSQLS
jgi:hypothetical protein